MRATARQTRWWLIRGERKMPGTLSGSSASAVKVGPTKVRGSTPTTVKSTLLSWTRRPMIVLSALNNRCQSG